MSIAINCSVEELYGPQISHAFFDKPFRNNNNGSYTIFFPDDSTWRTTISCEAIGYFPQRGYVGDFLDVRGAMVIYLQKIAPPKQGGGWF